MTDITIRFASSDQDVEAIHRFLCVIANRESVPGPIDGRKSAIEVWRVVYDPPNFPPGFDATGWKMGDPEPPGTSHDGCFALMALRDDFLIGTIGIVRCEHWWSDLTFMANRWFSAVPGSGAWLPLLRTARDIAVEAGVELYVTSEGRGRVRIFNKSKWRGVPYEFRQQRDHQQQAAVRHAIDDPAAMAH